MVAHSKSLPPPPPPRTRVRGKTSDQMVKSSKPGSVAKSVHPKDAIMSESDSECLDASLDCEWTGHDHD